MFLWVGGGVIYKKKSILFPVYAIFFYILLILHKKIYGKNNNSKPDLQHDEVKPPLRGLELACSNMSTFLTPDPFDTNKRLLHTHLTVSAWSSSGGGWRPSSVEDPGTGPDLTATKSCWSNHSSCRRASGSSWTHVTLQGKTTQLRLHPMRWTLSRCRRLQRELQDAAIP